MMCVIIKVATKLCSKVATFDAYFRDAHCWRRPILRIRCRTFSCKNRGNSREKMPMSGILTTHAIERKYTAALRFVSIQPERDQRSPISMATLR